MISFGLKTDVKALTVGIANTDHVSVESPVYASHLGVCHTLAQTEVILLYGQSQEKVLKKTVLLDDIISQLYSISHVACVVES